jgi:preprotein translocase subunit YajC
MGFFINDAWAESTTITSMAAQGGGFSQILILLAFVVIFYLLLWRPQAKRAKEHRQLMASLGIGDEVVTTGGIVGKVTVIRNDFATVKIAENVEVKMQKAAITSVLPKGTL